MYSSPVVLCDLMYFYLIGDLAVTSLLERFGEAVKSFKTITNQAELSKYD